MTGKKAATPKARAEASKRTSSVGTPSASTSRTTARANAGSGSVAPKAPSKRTPPAASAAPALSRTTPAPSGTTRDAHAGDGHRIAPEVMGRAMRWAQVTARDLMKTDVVTVPYNTPLSDIERILSDHKISGAPVADEGGRIVGILSIKDLIDRYTEDPDSRPRRDRGYFHLSSEELDEEDADAFELPAESEDTAQDVMTSQIYSVGPDLGLREIAAVMAKHRIHRVLVEEAGKFLGLLSTTEILEALSA